MDSRPAGRNTWDQESDDKLRSEALTCLQRWLGAPAELVWPRSGCGSDGPVSWVKGRSEFAVFRLAELPLEGLVEVVHDGLGAIRCHVVQTWRPGAQGPWPLDIDTVLTAITFTRLGPP